MPGRNARIFFFKKRGNFIFLLYIFTIFVYNVKDYANLQEMREDPMNIEFDVYKQKLNEVRPALEDLAASLNMEGLRNELERLHAMQEAPGFWDNPEKSQKIVMKTKQTENKIENYENMLSQWDDLMTICEMAAEEDDDSMLPELKDGFQQLSADMETSRLSTLLTGNYDRNNALVSFQAGAGGTEAQDWCQML